MIANCLCAKLICLQVFVNTLVWLGVCTFTDGSCWNIIIIKQILTFTNIMLFEQRRFGLGCLSLNQVKSCSSLYLTGQRFDLIKAGGAQTETSLFKQHDAWLVNVWTCLMVSALVPQVLTTQAFGIKLAFSMCLLQCLHCTDEAHVRPKQSALSCIVRSRSH